MDIEKLKILLPTFYEKLRARNYGDGYIGKYQYVAKSLFDIVENDKSLNTYEKAYSALMARRPYKKDSIRDYRRLIGHFKAFEEEGIFFPDTGKLCMFTLSPKAYDKLSPEFKLLIDRYVKKEREEGRIKEGSIQTMAGCMASLLLDIQRLGAKDLDEISEYMVRTVFGDRYGRHNSYHVSRHVMRVLTICQAMYPNGECHRLLAKIPEFPHKRKLFDYITKEECNILAASLNGEETPLTYKERAIGMLAFYMGMRASDISNLRFEDVDVDKEEIRFVQQKTGTEIRIPLLSVIGNAIADYILSERPTCNTDNIFVETNKPYCGQKHKRISHIARDIFKKTGIRQETGRNQGLHTMRHSFALSLIENDVERNTVRELMGHVSLESLNPYIDADIENLRECALDISSYIKVLPTMEPFKCRFSEILTQYRQESFNSCKWSYLKNIAFHSFDSFCQECDTSIGNSMFEILRLWMQPFPKESADYYKHRIQGIRGFLRYLHEGGCDVPTVPNNEVPTKKKQFLNAIPVSCAAPYILEYMDYKKTCKGSPTYYASYHLYDFDRFCLVNFPDSKGLCQEIIDGWCMQKSSENACTRAKRVSELRTFLKFLHRRGYGTFCCPVLTTRPKTETLLKKPHAFTESELCNFFFSLSHLTIKDSPESEITKLSLPIYFLLLLSSGLRTFEARLLDTKDVDFKNGIINVRHTKGYVEHRVALHPSMLKMLMEYDKAIERLVPKRKCFFPTSTDEHHSVKWVDYNFQKCWYEFNKEHAVAYDFRHRYATENINGLPADSALFNKHIAYLSRSMGHASFKMTMYYYNFTPKMAEHIKAAKAETFNDILLDRSNFYSDENI